MSLIGQGLSIGFPKIQSCKNQIDRFRTKFGMTNFKKLCAFTLSELLLSLTIVGVIAVLTVPVIVSNVQKRMFATKLRNFVAEIEQLAQQELIRHRTRDLFNTDFADPEKLLSDKHFKIVKSCDGSTAPRDCWKTRALGKDKIFYKNINKSSAGDTSNYKYYTIILKNGIILEYRLYNNYGMFFIDVNGSDKPNIAGRDYFAFLINKKGRTVDWGKINRHDYDQSLAACKNSSYGYYYCYSVLAKNNWKMDY